MILLFLLGSLLEFITTGTLPTLVIIQTLAVIVLFIATYWIPKVIDVRINWTDNPMSNMLPMRGMLRQEDIDRIKK